MRVFVSTLHSSASPKTVLVENGRLSAKLLQLLPKPLLTEDQLKLLKYDNVKSGIYKTNYDIGLKSSRIFEAEINKYSYNWRSGGQFANQKIFEKEK